MKTIKVTAKNINSFKPYQGQDEKLNINSILYIIETKLPSVRNNTTFAIVTDKKPNSSAKFIANRDGQKLILNTDNYYNANRWSISSKFLK